MKHPRASRSDRTAIYRLTRTARQLSRDDGGSMVIFSLFIMLMMLMVGGMAVDLMRYESKRAKLQVTLDRAVLAAADLQQTLDPETVVRDYFAKAGLADELRSVTVTQNFNSRTVEADASIDVQNMFMDMLGIDSLAAPAGGAATESITDVEIGLILDVSGSMGWGSKLQQLKSAGNDFIDTIFDGIDEEHITVSLVPYSTQVNLGLDVALLYGIVPGHFYSFCADLPASTYTSTAMPLVGLTQAGHFDADSYSGSYGGGMAANSPTCRTESTFEILPWSNDRDALKNRIQQLTAKGWTSIEIATNWGAALLDSSARPVLHGLITQGKVDPRLAGRPLDIFSPNTLKTLVIMTDGENTRHYEIAPQYRLGPSGVLWNGGNNYYVPSVEENNRDGDLIPLEPFYEPRYNRWQLQGPGVPLTWPDLFDRISVRSHAQHFRYKQYSRNADRNFWNDIVTTTETAAKDARLQQICDASKAKGFVVFTIGFEVTDRAAQVMSDCASSPAHFYRVEGLEIETAFNSIANQITALRLIQ